MNLTKFAPARVEQSGPLGNPSELEAVSAFAKSPLKAEDVYLFAVRLCDNQVDRDGEFFDRETLEQLAPLFVGKSGIFDHEWSAKHQTARIYRTEVVPQNGVVPASGETIAFLKGFAYMRRSEDNQSLIDDIEAGIKKEVSVSCAVALKRCSICHRPVGDPACNHQNGLSYDGKPCAWRLSDPTDAFEWSFVAVPAQKESGVVKALAGAQQPIPDQILKQAQLGQRYLDSLRKEVLRFGLLAKQEFSSDLLEKILAPLEEEELLLLQSVFQKDAGLRVPLHTQFQYGQAHNDTIVQDQAFCI